MNRFQKGDIVKRITELNRVQMLKVLGYFDDKHLDSVQVIAVKDLRECGEPFYVTEGSLTPTTKWDLLRNLSDKRLAKLLKPNWITVFEHMTKENLIEKWQNLYLDYDGSMLMLLETEEAQELSQLEMEYLLQWSGDDEYAIVTKDKKIKMK